MAHQSMCGLYILSGLYTEARGILSLLGSKSLHGSQMAQTKGEALIVILWALQIH